MKKNHIYFIDVLRGISIFLVLLHHFNIPYKIHLEGLDWINIICRNGNYGVTIFFVISGFLITQTSIKRYSSLLNINIKDFYIRRIARILPCLTLLIFLVSILVFLKIPVFINHTPNGVSVSYAETVLSALTFSMNILIIHYGWVNYVLGVLWSLSVEEVFYIAFPIIFTFFISSIKSIYPIFVFIILYAIYFRSQFYMDKNEAYLYHYFSSFDAIVIGCMLGLLYNNKKYVRYLYQLRYMTIIVLIFLYCYKPIHDVSTWSMTVFALLIAILIYSYQDKYKNKIMFKLLIYMGQRSYEIYLFHLIFLGFIKLIFTPSATSYFEKILLCGVYLIISVILGNFIEKYYSNPLNQKIRKRFLI